MEEVVAEKILVDVADYANLSTFNSVGAADRLYKLLAKKGYDCTPEEEITFELAQELRLYVLSALSYMSGGGMMGEGDKYVVCTRIVSTPVSVRVVFDKEHLLCDFDLSGTGLNGVLFALRLAMTATRGNRARRCLHCSRYFFATRNDAKWCSDSCKVRASKWRKEREEIGRMSYKEQTRAMIDRKSPLFVKSWTKREAAILEQMLKDFP